MDERAVVTGFLHNGGEILLLKRSEDVGSYQGRWGGVAGHVEDHDNPAEAVQAEIREETGCNPDSLSLVRSGDSFTVSDPAIGIRWTVLPFLFDCPTRTVELDWEHDDFEWVAPTAILDRETVPQLWQSYDRVRPTVEVIETDQEHGSAALSVTALGVLRDEAGLLRTAPERTEFDATGSVARRLLAARPSMCVLTNRINRVMATAGTEPAAVEAAAIVEIERARSADTRAAEALQPWLDGARVGTLSRSGTVLQAVQHSDPDAVMLPESRPGREGVDVAEALAPTVAVTMTSDAAFPGQLCSWDADVLVVGADALFADGAVRNKVGTWPAAAVASDAGITVVVATAVDKISPEESHQPEHRPEEQLYDGDASLSLLNPTFERTPPALIDSYVTDRGELAPAAIRSLATEFEKRAHWLA